MPYTTDEGKGAALLEGAFVGDKVFVLLAWGLNSDQICHSVFSIYIYNQRFFSVAPGGNSPWTEFPLPGNRAVATIGPGENIPPIGIPFSKHLLIFLWWFSRNPHKFKKYVCCKISGTSPQTPFYLLIIAL